MTATLSSKDKAFRFFWSDIWLVLIILIEEKAEEFNYMERKCFIARVIIGKTVLEKLLKFCPLEAPCITLWPEKNGRSRYKGGPL